MAQVNLPAHLANRQSRNLTGKAVAGLGSLLPPHISIQGNTFTLIDAAGNEQTAGATLDCVVVDVSDVNCKKYFGKAWEPGSNDPPDCWSANGVAPSRDAVSPQARTCAECPHNVRGSKISAISGAAIKACRDEKWLALLLPSIPNMLFQLVLTPGSFDNWKAYNKKFEGNGMDLDFVITRLSFVAKTNGVLAFDAPGFVEPQITALVDAALAEKKTDVLVGRNDVPRDPALMPPQGQSAAPLSLAPAPTAASPSTGTAFGSAPNSPIATPAASPSENGRRKRRNTAQAEAPAAAPQTMAPFRPQQEAPAGNGAFGMASGVEPNAEIAGAINSVFGKP